MATTFVRDEFNNESLEAFWGSSATGDGTLTERQKGDLYFTATKGDWVGVWQDDGGNGLQDTLLDVWTRLEITTQYLPGTCDAQFWVEDYVEYDGSIACSIAYHNPVPDANTTITGERGWGWYIWAWKSSNGWASERYHYIRIDQPYAYCRIRAQVNGVCRVYYALEEPKWDTDWIEVSLPNPIEYLPTNLGAVYLTSGSFSAGWEDEDVHSVSLDFIREWSEPPSTRVQPRQINFYKAAPTKVSDMKDGEMRLADDQMYGRVGDQVLLKSLPLSGWLAYDEFDDDVIGYWWTTWTQNGIVVTEENSELVMTCDGSQAYQSNYWKQTPLVNNAVDFSFDLYIDAETSGALIGYDFADVAYDYWIGVQLDWDNSIAGKYALAFYAQDNPTWVDMPYIEVPALPGGDARVWVRYRYDPNATRKFTAWYSLTEPTSDEDWIFVDFGLYFTTVSDLEIYGGANSGNSVGDTNLFKTDYLRDESTPLTIPTTTTTTTT